MSMYMYVCIPCICPVPTKTKRVSDPLELETGVIDGCVPP